LDVGHSLYVCIMQRNAASRHLDAVRDDANTDEPVASLIRRPLPDGGDALLAEIVRRLGPERKVYVSTPITTGPRYLAWLLSRSTESGAPKNAEKRAMRSEAIAANLLAVAPLRARIRRKWPDASVVDPTEVNEPTWGQEDFHRFWIEVLRRLQPVVAFAEGWEYSTGCAVEFSVALQDGLDLRDADLKPLTVDRAVTLLRRAAEDLDAATISSAFARAALARALESLEHAQAAHSRRTSQLKDERLAQVAAKQSVAIFASFEPESVHLRYFETSGDLGTKSDLSACIRMLLRESREHRLNVRSFSVGDTKGSPFIYGLETVEAVVKAVRELASLGLYTIVNETIDVHDGGVSGVRIGNVVEFLPDTTPRGVETGESVQMSVAMAEGLLSTAYGFGVSLPGDRGERVEFSLHPSRVGTRHSHLLTWEVEDVASPMPEPRVSWPNAFSRLVGDKTFGLLVADYLGANVPRTTAMPRRLAPFVFGTPTGTGEKWLRTAPAEQQPGRFTTLDTWDDMYDLVKREDPESEIAAVLAQEAVASVFAGATTSLDDGTILVEGVRSSGNLFMLGEAPSVLLPAEVVQQVEAVVKSLSLRLGPVGTEWAYDGERVWILQVHIATPIARGAISAGEATEWRDYYPSEGLSALRALIEEIEGSATGVLVKERIGITSHVGDLLRKHGIPARFDVSTRTDRSRP
jgi:hypothetical protein